MKIGYFILNDGLREDPSVTGLLSDLEAASYSVYEIRSKSDVLPETDLVLSMGGDGTFLSAAHLVSDIGIPILGVNYGRIGFLCENRPEEVLKALMALKKNKGCSSGCMGMVATIVTVASAACWIVCLMI